MTRILRPLSLFALCLCTTLALWVSMPPFALQIDESQLRATAQREHGAQGVNNLEKWLDMVATMQGEPEEQQLEAINRFWNQIAVAGEDIDIWGVEDYWASPLETLGVGAADCEDYEIGRASCREGVSVWGCVR